VYAVKFSSAVFIIALTLIGPFYILPDSLWGETLQSESQCVQCHANLKKLIRLCWEVEKTQPKPKTSAETSGEG
jgi:hypothetical protein